jgi:hypothetical protein
MTVDISKIRPGDEVAIRGVVSNISTTNFPEKPILVEIDGAHGLTSTRVAYETIVSHIPKGFVVGDRVRLLPTFHDEEVSDGWDLLQIDDSSMVLLGRGNHTRKIASKDKLERVS